MNHLICFLIAAVVRGIDTWTTHLVTPDLRWEQNPIYRKTGWDGVMTLNIVASVSMGIWGNYKAIPGFAIITLFFAWSNYRIYRKGLDKHPPLNYPTDQQ